MKHEQIYDQVLEAADGLSRRSSRRQELRAQHAAQRARWGGVDGLYVRAGEFRCLQCGALVTVDPLYSGVNNRNHCPYCLWSRCMDLFTPGDRLSACRGKMQPVGLSRKPGRNKYAPGRSGELLLVHLCVECGRVSLNRLAADDNPENVEAVFHAASQLDIATRSRLALAQVCLLAESELDYVREQLYGKL